MKAAVVHSFREPPRYGAFTAPSAGEGETLVRVRAAALTHLVKSQAAGRHYSSGAALPAVPGADGVGRLPDGRRVYFAFPERPHGSMAELSRVKEAYCVPLPDGVDDVTAAAIANPGMSSWAALTERARFRAGETVLINGATGTSGRLAVQIARHLGAGRIIATGRNTEALEKLETRGADATISLTEEPATLARRFRETMFQGPVHVILDYLWGSSAKSLIAALSGRGGDEAEPRVRYVQIGAVSGATIALPGAALRSSGLELMGSGLGSVSHPKLVAVIRDLMTAAAAGALTIETETVPLAEVETAWDRATDRRLVFTV